MHCRKHALLPSKLASLYSRTWPQSASLEGTTELCDDNCEYPVAHCDALSTLSISTSIFFYQMGKSFKTRLNSVHRVQRKIENESAALAICYCPKGTSSMAQWCSSQPILPTPAVACPQPEALCCSTSAIHQVP